MQYIVNHKSENNKLACVIAHVTYIMQSNAKNKEIIKYNQSSEPKFWPKDKENWQRRQPCPVDPDLTKRSEWTNIRLGQQNYHVLIYCLRKEKNWERAKFSVHLSILIHPNFQTNSTNAYFHNLIHHQKNCALSLRLWRCFALCCVMLIPLSYIRV
jgi:hypothetical protein